MSNEKQFIAELTINNTKENKFVEIDGVQQEVEVPAKEGFNLKTKDLEGQYNKEFFMKELEGIILLERYQIQSKYEEKPMYMSTEFLFMGDKNYLEVYCPEKKEVTFKGNYQGAVNAFATGKMTDYNKPEKTFDVFSIIYVLIEGEVFRFRWKMTQNNNWFAYKDGCKIDKNSREDTHDYRKVQTKFGLSKKKFGSNEFWVCTLQNIGEATVDVTQNAKDLEDLIDSNAPVEEASPMQEFGQVEIQPEIEEVEEEINVSSIPF